MTRTQTGLGATSALLTLVAPAVLAAPAFADIDGIRVLGATDGQQCSISTGCAIRAALTGGNQYAPVDFLVNDAAIGSATPIRDSTGAVSATLEWRPTQEGTYTVGVRQGQSLSTIVYTVTKNGSGCGWAPTGSGTGSAGSGSASSSAGSGSASTGSAGSGSAGSGSAGSGSASGSAC